jgi:Flp pilus assembly secretin CpaC
LEPITKTNDNITLQLVDEANLDQPNKPKKYLQIFAKQSGTTSITLKDAEGTIVVITVNVTGTTKAIEDTAII